MPAFLFLISTSSSVGAPKVNAAVADAANRSGLGSSAEQCEHAVCAKSVRHAATGRAAQLLEPRAAELNGFAEPKI